MYISSRTNLSDSRTGNVAMALLSKVTELMGGPTRLY
jgi:hypothetical protein